MKSKKGLVNFVDALVLKFELKHWLRLRNKNKLHHRPAGQLH